MVEWITAITTLSAGQVAVETPRKSNRAAEWKRAADHTMADETKLSVRNLDTGSMVDLGTGVASSEQAHSDMLTQMDQERRYNDLLTKVHAYIIYSQ